MSQPISVDLPHSLGAAEARRRIAANVGGLTDKIPGGAKVDSAWDGDRLDLAIGAMGQQVSASLDVQESLVRVTVRLPGALGFFGGAIESALKSRGPELLEDRSGKS